ncbi:hypothetical protein [Streptomyces sp. NPDC050485]|uniref:hypothetical protein n=1 Tax=Streptomyces sp. NPDC050485 TaxID=3365617 RepID=UPI0037A1BFD0
MASTAVNSATAFSSLGSRGPYSGGKYGTSTSIFVGSYDYSYEVVSEEGKKVEVKITVEDETTFNSLVHPPIARDAWDKWIGGPVDSAADWFGGPMRTKKQRVSWTEELEEK